MNSYADAPVRVFAMGVNEWREHALWPPAGTVATPFYLRSEAALSLERPTGEDSPDSYSYDPDDPTPMVQNVEAMFTDDLSLDNRWRLERDDVLVYTSGPLEHDLEITGHPFVVL